MRFLMLILAISVAFTSGFAQEVSVHAPEVVESPKNMFQGPKNCFSITMMNAKDKVVEELWEDLIKTYDSKVKRVRKADVRKAEDVRIQAISGTGTINIYSLIEELGEDVVFSIWLEMDDGNFLSTSNYPNSVTEVEKLLQNFGISVKRKMVEIELEDEQDELEDLNKDLEKMVKEKEKLEGDIEDYKKRIEEAKKDIESNLENQNSLKEKIEEQKTQVEMISKKLGDIQ